MGIIEDAKRRLGIGQPRAAQGPGLPPADLGEVKFRYAPHTEPVQIDESEAIAVSKGMRQILSMVPANSPGRGQDVRESEFVLPSDAILQHAPIVATLLDLERSQISHVGMYVSDGMSWESQLLNQVNSDMEIGVRGVADEAGQLSRPVPYESIHVRAKRSADPVGHSVSVREPLVRLGRTISGGAERNRHPEPVDAMDGTGLMVVDQIRGVVRKLHGEFVSGEVERVSSLHPVQQALVHALGNEGHAIRAVSGDHFLMVGKLNKAGKLQSIATAFLSKDVVDSKWNYLGISAELEASWQHRGKEVKGVVDYIGPALGKDDARELAIFRESDMTIRSVVEASFTHLQRESAMRAAVAQIFSDYLRERAGLVLSKERPILLATSLDLRTTR